MSAGRKLAINNGAGQRRKLAANVALASGSRNQYQYGESASPERISEKRIVAVMWRCGGGSWLAAGGCGSINNEESGENEK
jgi:hypothetical protein